MSNDNFTDLETEFNRVAAKAIAGHRPSLKRLPDLAEALIAAGRDGSGEAPAVATQCDLESCSRVFQPRKEGQRFCCAGHRAQWARENGSVVPGMVQSVTPSREGARIVVVRVLPADSPRAAAWVPGKLVDLLERT